MPRCRRGSAHHSIPEGASQLYLLAAVVVAREKPRLLRQLVARATEAVATATAKLLPQLAAMARATLLPLRLEVRAMEAVATAKAKQLLKEKVMAAIAPPSTRLCQ